MAGLRRFLHLERPRTAKDDAAGARGTVHPERRPALGGPKSREEPPGNAARFGALEGIPAGGTPAGGEVTGAATGRFGPDREPGLELAERDPAARPFQRCPACGRDHGLHEHVCTCGARLDTPEVLAWNDRLWQERAAEDARLAAEGEEARARAAREAEELARLKREMGIELAKQVGERERARLGTDSGWSSGGGLPLGVRLWGWLPERLRVKVAGGIAAGWLVLLVAGLARRSQGMIIAAIALAVLLLAPPGRTRGRWGSWD